MTIRAFPFEEADVGTYPSDYWRTYVSALWSGGSDGVAYPSNNTQLLVTADSGTRVVKVATGTALVGGRLINNDSAATQVTLLANSSGQPRIDLIVAEWRTANLPSPATITYVQGTPSATPSAPSVTQTNTVYQIALAEVYCSSGFTTVTSSHIFDRRTYYNRSGTDLPGRVHWSLATINDVDSLAAEPGYLLPNGRSIGSTASGASHGGEKYFQLFEKLWTYTSNTYLQIQNSSGAGTTKGSTAWADWLADKRMPTPDLRGRMLVSPDNLGQNPGSANVITASWADNLPGTGGTETITLSIAQIPAHNHGGVTGLSGAGALQFAGAGASGSAAASTQGSGQAHDNTQPGIVAIPLMRY